MERFPCPYLNGEVELTSEREQHIIETHPNLLPEHRERITETLTNPEPVTRSITFENTRLFSKYYDVSRKRKYAVVVVVSDTELTERNWIVTAYMARKVPQGEVEWTRN